MQTCFYSENLTVIVESTFKPAWWLRNPHLQTILPRIYRKRSVIDTLSEQFDLEDGDFLQLNWTEKPQAQSTKPIVVVFHGLGGSIDSFYATGMMKRIIHEGWIGVLMHFRGSGERPNRHAQAYHSGATAEATEFLTWLKNNYPNRPLAAIGFSLGGNVLAKYLGEQGGNSPLDAAVVISAPLRLAPCAVRLNNSFSRVYQKYLLDKLKVGIIGKINYLKGNFPIKITISEIKAIKTLREFDNKITGPLHGFIDADDYYARCSGLPFLKNVTTNTLIIHAADDPFMTHQVHPQPQDLSPTVRYELSSGGGHVGFLSGKNPLKPRFWLEQRAPEYIKQQFAGLKRHGTT